MQSTKLNQPATRHPAPDRAPLRVSTTPHRPGAVLSSRLLVTTAACAPAAALLHLPSALASAVVVASLTATRHHSDPTSWRRGSDSSPTHTGTG